MPGIGPKPLASPAVGVPMPGSLSPFSGPATGTQPAPLPYDVYLEDEEWRLEGRWRWLMTALLVLGLAGLVVNQETYAATTFIVRNPNNAFQTGYVELSVNDNPVNTAIISAYAIMPGVSASAPITIKNTGTEDIGTIRVSTESIDSGSIVVPTATPEATATTVSGATATPIPSRIATMTATPTPVPVSAVLTNDAINGLQIAYDRCSEEWITPTKSSATTSSTCPGQATLNFFACKVVSARVLIGYPGRSLPPGGKDFIRVRITLPETAGREYMGLGASIRFRFEASQEPAPLAPESCSMLTSTPAATSTPAPTSSPAPSAGGSVTVTPSATATSTPFVAHEDSGADMSGWGATPPRQSPSSTPGTPVRIPNTPVPATRTYGAGTPSPTITPLATVPTSTPVGAHGDPATPGPPPPTPSPFLGFRTSPTPSVLHIKSVPDESADGVLP